MDLVRLRPSRAIPGIIALDSPAQLSIVGEAVAPCAGNAYADQLVLVIVGEAAHPIVQQISVDIVGIAVIGQNHIHRRTVRTPIPGGIRGNRRERVQTVRDVHVVPKTVVRIQRRRRAIDGHARRRNRG